jgi:hypothetical protein
MSTEAEESFVKILYQETTSESILRRLILVVVNCKVCELAIAL